jgi:RNA recognition motif-containing protein
MKVHIGNLNSATTEQELSDLLTPFGIVHCSRIKTIANTDKYDMSAFAYAHFQERENGEEAALKLDNQHFMGNVITVKEAR